jgi:hypothetical protein
MSGKVKMRCARCGKPFKSNNTKQTLCPECEAKERAARAASKTAPKPVAAASAPIHKPKIVGIGAHILVPGMTPPVPSQLAENVRADGGQRREPATAGAQAPHERPQHDAKGAPPQPSRQPSPAPDAQGDRQRSPKASKQPRPPQAPFHLSAEQHAVVEARYLELAQPIEYDGIRTQIATELGVPKSAVKKAILELRQRMQMPSWWELQAYKGSDADLERIRQAYVPHLPVPEVGIHRRLAADLNLDQAAVYQGIRRIRAEMRLPQYNAPELHGTPEQPRPDAATPQPAGARTEGAVGEAH